MSLPRLRFAALLLASAAFSQLVATSSSAATIHTITRSQLLGAGVSYLTLNIVGQPTVNPIVVQIQDAKFDVPAGAGGYELDIFDEEDPTEIIDRVLLFNDPTASGAATLMSLSVGRFGAASEVPITPPAHPFINIGSYPEYQQISGGLPLLDLSGNPSPLNAKIYSYGFSFFPNYRLRVTLTAPEPSSIALAILGGAGLALVARKRRRTGR